MKIYFVSRVECGGKLCEPIGVALTESEAVAMCVCQNDGIVELEAGVRYQTGEMLPAGVRDWFPLCPDVKVAEAVEMAPVG